MRKNLKVVCATAIAAATLLAPVLAQAADPTTQESQTVGQSQRSTTTPAAPATGTPAIAGKSATPQRTPTTQSQQTGTPAPSVSAQDQEPSTSPLTRGATCSDTGAMTHGHWTLAPSAEYDGECTLTFTADDPGQENDFAGLESYNPSMAAAMTSMGEDTSPHTHFGTRISDSTVGMLNPSRVQEFGQAEHIVFEGPSKTKLPENAAFMFGDWGCDGSGYSSCNLKSFKSNNALDTSQTTDMRGLFQASTNMKDLDLSGWDTSNVKTIYSMFDGCGVADLDLSGWDTSSITNMHQAFWRMPNLKSLNLSGWDTSAVAGFVDGMTGTNDPTGMGDIFNVSNFSKLTIGPKTKLTTFNQNNFKGSWVKVTKLSNGTSGTTQAATGSTPQNANDLNTSLTNDPNRAGTYVWAYNNQQRTLTLNANLPSGYSATAAATGYTDAGNGNLSATVSGMNITDVPTPEYNADGNLSGRESSLTINTLNGNVNLPTSDPFTLTAAPGTSDTYTFKGWSTAPNAAVADHNDGDTVNLSGADITLYAVWKKNAKEPSHVTTPAPGTSTPSKPSETTPSHSSTVSKPSHTHTGDAGNVTVQPVTPAPTPTASLSTTKAPTLAPVAAALPAAQTLATPAVATAPTAAAVAVAPGARTAATPTNPTTPTSAADQSVDETPSNVSPQRRQKSCEVAYYTGGSVAPAAVICKTEGAAMTSIRTPTHSIAPAWIFMLVIAAAFMATMFLYQRRKTFLAAQHRSMEAC